MIQSHNVTPTTSAYRAHRTLKQQNDRTKPSHTSNDLNHTNNVNTQMKDRDWRSRLKNMTQSHAVYEKTTSNEMKQSG